MALSHVIGDKAEQAYRRSDALDKRRKLMDAWANYCEPKGSGTVVPLVRKDKKIWHNNNMNQLVIGHARAQTDSPFVSALSLPMFNRPAPRWGKIGQPQGILSGLFGVIRGAIARPVAVARVPSTGRSTSVGGRRVCRSAYVRRLAWFRGCALRLKAW